MEMSLIDLIQNVGFPIGVCIYLFWQQKTILSRVEKALNNNTKALDLLTIQLKK